MEQQRTTAVSQHHNSSNRSCAAAGAPRPPCTCFRIPGTTMSDSQPRSRFRSGSTAPQQARAGHRQSSTDPCCPSPFPCRAVCAAFLFLETLFSPASQTTGQNIRKLIKDGLVIQKPTVIHSRHRARQQAEAKAKGRHSGYGEATPLRLHSADNSSNRSSNDSSHGSRRLRETTAAGSSWGGSSS